MKNFTQHIIQDNITILGALNHLNKLTDTLTLFVIDNNNRLIGTLTDGDIRRGFVEGLKLDDNIKHFMSMSYHYLNNEVDSLKIKEIKKDGIELLPVLNEKNEIIKVYNLKRLKSVLPVDAVIMAGGRGERLRPLTDNIPKSMLKLGDKPIIEYTIDRLIEFGIENIYISIHYLGNQIKEYLGDGSHKGIKIQYIEEDKPLGTIGASSHINDFTNDTILLTNSDLFTNIDYEDFFLAFQNESADMAVASIPYTVNIPYAILEKTGSRVHSFKEKPINTHSANAGIYLIKRKHIDLIPKNTYFNTTDLMQKAINANLILIHNPIIGYWIDIGKHEDYLKAQEIVKHLKK
jgi:dTDP-glucose pyrophosphorylase